MTNLNNILKLPQTTHILLPLFIILRFTRLLWGGCGALGFMWLYLLRQCYIVAPTFVVIIQVLVDFVRQAAFIGMSMLMIRIFLQCFLFV